MKKLRNDGRKEVDGGSFLALLRNILVRFIIMLFGLLDGDG